ncbi:hypothetical protein J6590_035286 [Homalodisca vitripennis]|nr:hypothetical protein J6590_035286 [Homalodisca vitripennis]
MWNSKQVQISPETTREFGRLSARVARRDDPERPCPPTEAPGWCRGRRPCYLRAAAVHRSPDSPVHARSTSHIHRTNWRRLNNQPEVFLQWPTSYIITEYPKALQ